MGADSTSWKYFSAAFVSFSIHHAAVDSTADHH
jgi:hypothetical protein